MTDKKNKKIEPLKNLKKEPSQKRISQSNSLTHNFLKNLLTIFILIDDDFDKD